MQTTKRLLKMKDFKQELFMGLFSNHYGEDKVTLDDLVNRTMLVNAKLNDESHELADLRDGEFGGIELNEAIEKLAFELQNDRDLYRAYQNKLSYVIYEALNEEEGIEVNDGEKAAEFAESVAQTFLDAYINDALRTKKDNEEYKREQMPDELEVK